MFSLTLVPVILALCIPSTSQEQQDNTEKPSIDHEKPSSNPSEEDSISEFVRSSLPEESSGPELTLYLIIAGVILAVVVFVVIGIDYKKRRQRAALIAAYDNQANQECAQTNTEH